MAEAKVDSQVFDDLWAETMKVVRDNMNTLLPALLASFVASRQRGDQITQDMLNKGIATQDPNTKLLKLTNEAKAMLPDAATPENSVISEMDLPSPQITGVTNFIGNGVRGVREFLQNAAAGVTGLLPEAVNNLTNTQILMLPLVVSAIQELQQQLQVQGDQGLFLNGGAGGGAGSGAGGDETKSKPIVDAVTKTAWDTVTGALDSMYEAVRDMMSSLWSDSLDMLVDQMETICIDKYDAGNVIRSQFLRDHVIGFYAVFVDVAIDQFIEVAGFVGVATNNAGFAATVRRLAGRFVGNSTITDSVLHNIFQIANHLSHAAMMIASLLKRVYRVALELGLEKILITHDLKFRKMLAERNMENGSYLAKLSL
jgi:hypothetical protein